MDTQIDGRTKKHTDGQTDILNDDYRFFIFTYLRTHLKRKEILNYTLNTFESTVVQHIRPLSEITFE